MACVTYSDKKPANSVLIEPLAQTKRIISLNSTTYDFKIIAINPTNYDQYSNGKKTSW
jgi:hypothetical protein